MLERQETVEARTAHARSAPGRMAERAYAQVLGRLLTGHLQGGEVVQESRLASELGLSRTPVRDALGRLEGEGLLTRSGRLLTVRRVSVKEFLDLLHVRLLIEPEAAALAAGVLDPKVLAALRADVAGMRDDLSSEELWSIDDRVHLGIVEVLQNEYLANLVRGLRRRTRLFEASKFPGRVVSGRQEHLAMIDALIAGDAVAAHAAMKDHLESVRSLVIERLRRL